jgi:hypothetical protein
MHDAHVPLFVRRFVCRLLKLSQTLGMKAYKFHQRESFSLQHLIAQLIAIELIFAHRASASIRPG